ncbi:MAG TPA: HAD family hydrolase [Deltaproteobacteria bacterium]|nr:HAD family hydrolase [Deltaproteobacteria bacterium]
MASPSPIPWHQASDAELASIKGICLDIDETLSTRGKLTDEAFAALWNLQRAGFCVVPVTGRPAGWCDHIARFWPVHAVVGENGAFTFFMQKGLRSRLDTPGTEVTPMLRLEQLGRKVLARFPHAKWASDQAYREYDLAIDICEDVPPWPASDIEELLRLCEAEGAHAKLSSVHVNAWFGDYDKCRGLKFWLESGAPGITGPVPRWDEWLFIGDSPNDEPMFASFRFSVGVANLAQYLDRLRHPPTWLTSRESGAGFAEMVGRLIHRS